MDYGPMDVGRMGCALPYIHAKAESEDEDIVYTASDQLAPTHLVTWRLVDFVSCRLQSSFQPGWGLVRVV